MREECVHSHEKVFVQPFCQSRARLSSAHFVAVLSFRSIDPWDEGNLTFHKFVSFKVAFQVEHSVKSELKILSVAGL